MSMKRHPQWQAYALPAVAVTWSFASEHTRGTAWKAYATQTMIKPLPIDAAMVSLSAAAVVLKSSTAFENQRRRTK
jgi:hypothetical protein